jgi:hypothetical protein
MRRVGKASGRATRVRWRAHHSILTSGTKMVGTALMRLCPPYENVDLSPQQSGERLRESGER